MVAKDKKAARLNERPFRPRVSGRKNYVGDNTASQPVLPSVKPEGAVMASWNFTGL